MTAYGARVDAGRYGILDHDADGDPICHVCGTGCQQLATHARYAHGIRTAADYRARYGLGATTRLVGAEASARMRAAWDRHEAEHLERLNATRDPSAAYQASRAAAGVGGADWAPEVRARRQAVGRASRSHDLTPNQVASLGDGVDLQAWSDAARALIQQGTSLAALGRAADISPATASQRLRRYPPR